VQHHAADHLHIEMALTQGPLGGLAHGGEGGGEQFVEGAASGDLRAEVIRAGAQGLIAEGGDLCLQGVDGRHFRGVGLEAAVVGRAENLTRKRTKHCGIPKRRSGACAR